jgi:hypothetical protein
MDKEAVIPKWSHNSDSLGMNPRYKLVLRWMMPGPLIRNAMVVLLKKEMARAPDTEVQKCVEQMNMYIHGQIPFNFDELDNFQLGEQQDLDVPLSKNVTKLSLATELDEGPDTAVAN